MCVCAAAINTAPMIKLERHLRLPLGAEAFISSLCVQASLCIMYPYAHAQKHATHTLTHTHTQGTTVVVGALRDGRAFSVTLTRIFPELKNVTNEGIRQLLR